MSPGRPYTSTRRFSKHVCAWGRLDKSLPSFGCGGYRSVKRLRLMRLVRSMTLLLAWHLQPHLALGLEIFIFLAPHLPISLQTSHLGQMFWLGVRTEMSSTLSTLKIIPVRLPLPSPWPQWDQPDCGSCRVQSCCFSCSLGAVYMRCSRKANVKLFETCVIVGASGIDVGKSDFTVLGGT